MISPSKTVRRSVRLFLLPLLAALLGPTARAETMTPAQEKAMVAIFQESGRGGDLFRKGRVGEAETVFRAVLDRVSADFPREALMRASALHNLAAAVSERGRPAEAEPLAREALALRDGRGVAPAIASSRLLLGQILADLGRAAQAEGLLRPAVATLWSDPAADRADAVKATATLAVVLAETGAGEAAAGLAGDLTKLLPNLAGRPDLTEAVLAATARVAALAGRAGEAEVLYRRAHDAVDRTRADAEARRAMLLSNVASVLIDQGRAADAVPILDRVVGSSETAGLGPASRAAALANLGEARRATGDTAGAFAAKRRALDLRLTALPANHPLVAQTFASLGLDLLTDGQPGPARDAFRAALARREAAGDRLGVARTSLDLAVAEAALGNAAEADRRSAAGLAALETLLPEGHAVRAGAAVNRAWLLLGAGRAAEALTVARKAAKGLAARVATATGGEGERIGLPVTERRGVVVAVAAAWEVAAKPGPAGKSPREPVEALRDEAFRAAQFALVTRAGSAAAQVAARFAAGPGDLAATIRKRQDLAEGWRARDRRVLERLGHTDAAAEAELAGLRRELDDIAGRIRGLDAELATRFPAYAELADPRPLAEAEVRRLLAPDEALVTFLVTPAETWAFAISPKAATWTRIPLGEKDLADRIASLRRTLDPAGPTRAGESAFGEATEAGRTGFDRRVAHDLHTALFAPLAAVLGPASKWLVVADGPLTGLPPSLLVTAPPQGDDADPEALRATAWLVRSKATTTLPAVSSLRALRAVPRAAAGGDPFRGFGAPSLGGSGGPTRGVTAYFRGGRADVEAVRALSPLPATEGELRRLATALKAGDRALTLGAAATETAVKSADLARARVIAFATHGLVTGELAGLAEPALVFTPPAAASDVDDGLLTASEAAQLKLAADWVVLSACNTAAGDGRPGAEGLSGLARAFLHAGARALLVSHWPVRDDAAADLTTRTFALLAATPSLGRAEALRRAMVELIDRGDPSLVHPTAWAPFVVVGEGN